MAWILNVQSKNWKTEYWISRFEADLCSGFVAHVWKKNGVWLKGGKTAKKAESIYHLPFYFSPSVRVWGAVHSAPCP